MAHALAPDLGEGDFNTAFFADDAFILHPLVLAAQAFVILDWAKNPGAEQAIPFRLEGTIVDRFRLFDFAKGPGANTLRRGQRNPDTIKALETLGLSKKLHQLIHSALLCARLA